MIRNRKELEKRMGKWKRPSAHSHHPWPAWPASRTGPACPPLPCRPTRPLSLFPGPASNVAQLALALARSPHARVHSPAGRGPVRARPRPLKKPAPHSNPRIKTLLGTAAAHTPTPPAPLLNSRRVYLPGHGRRGWLEPPRSPSAQRYKRVATAPPLSSPCSRRSPLEPHASALAHRTLRASPS